MAENSFLADSSFSASRLWAFANTGGSGTIGTVCRTGCLGVEALEPLADSTSGYSASKSRYSYGVESSAASRWDLLLNDDEKMQK